MGLSFFCGLCLQHSSAGGPGYWGQKLEWNATELDLSGRSSATGVPWASTLYGSNPYYYNLNYDGFPQAIRGPPPSSRLSLCNVLSNYDGFPQAIASLYVVMIQNNWNVAAGHLNAILTQF